MAEFSRLLSCHPKNGGEFELRLSSRDPLAHSAIGNMDRQVVLRINEILTDASGRIRQLISENTDWEVIGR